MPRARIQKQVRPKEERRRYGRIRLNRQISMSWDGGVVLALVTDFGLGGASLLCDLSLPIGTKVKLLIPIDSSGERAERLGRIVWKHYERMGVAFEGTAPKERAHL